MHIIGKLRILVLVLITVFLFAFALNAQAETEKELSSGETVYVSIYSNVYSGPKKVPLELSSMLSIRNTDSKYSITILSADYYDSSGKKIESYIKSPVKLNPHFIVKWSAKKKVNQPIIEGLMLGLGGGKGVAFMCPGQVITEH
jgi:hypothetical protein